MKTIKSPKKKKTKKSLQDITKRKRAEEALKESEKKFRTIFKGAGDGILVADVKTKRFHFANPRICEITGYSLKELLKLNVTKIHPKKDLPYALEQFIKQVQGEITLAKNIPVLRKNKKIVYCDINSKPVRIGKKKLLVGFFRDITERKKAEERLRLLSSIVEQSTEGIAMSDLGGNLLFVNKAFAAMHGYTPKELIGKHLSIFHTPEQMPSVEAANQQIRETGKFSGEIWHVRHDGTIFPTLMHNSLLRNERSDPIGMIGTLRDITELKRAEAALREEKNKLKKYFDVAEVIILVLSPENKVLLINKKGCEILGCKGEEIIGKDWFTNFIPEKNRAEAKIVFEKLMGERMDHAEYFEGPILTKGGKEKIIAWRNAPLKDAQDRAQAILSVGGDITELKQAKITIEQLKEVDKLKDDFLNIATHELRTPLTSIVGLSEIIKMQEPSLNSQYRKYINIIYDEGIKLSHIIKRILTVTRFESGRETVYSEPFNLTVFISSFLSALNILAKKKNSKIIINIEKKNIVIRSDKEKISQVIYNFIDNAVKYGPEGQTITLSITKPEKDWVKIEVKDQGPGISPKLQKKLFTKFSQLEPSLTRSQEGTGLGLYICKLIVDKLSGKIGVKSVLGKGSTFYFTFPIITPSQKKVIPFEREILSSRVG